MFLSRFVWLALGIFALFAILVSQFYRIQVVEAKKWKGIANRQHFFSVDEPFQRGVFWSNTAIKKGHPQKPQPFVVDIEAYHLFSDPASIPQEYQGEIVSELTQILNLTPEEGEGLKVQLEKRSRSRRLVLWLDRNKKETIRTWWFPFARRHRIPQNALFFVTDYQRSYPFGKLLGQVLHTIQGHKDEQTKQALPTGGLELYFQDDLTGKLGKRLLKRSPRNAFETGDILTPPEHGADVYLTINHFLQAIAEEELEKGVRQCKAKSGWAVMMDPKTGEVLAIAQYPFFNPVEYKEYFNDPAKVEATRLKPLCDAHEPGSVLKPITLAIGLKANRTLQERGEPPLLDPEAKVACANGHFPGRKPLSDLGRVHPFLNLNMALQKSSNIYMGRLIEKVIEQLGNDWYRDQLVETFGFSKKTGVEYPSESLGLVPTPGRVHPNGKLEWSKPTPISLAMGHNIQANSLQMLRAYSVIANGGILVDPTLVRKVVKTKQDGTVEILLDHTRAERVQNFPRVLDQEDAERVKQAMKYVTKEGGSGKRANIWGYTEAAKTGTAEKIVDGQYAKKLNVATFIGMVPVQDPCFVLLVSMDEPENCYIPGVGKNQLGGVCAAPVFQKIAQRSLEYLGVPPDDPYGYPPNDPRYDPDLADWIPESRSLIALYQEWNG